MRKRAIVLFVLLTALAGAAVSQALTLLAEKYGTAKNVITFGSLTMELHETDGEGQPVDTILHLMDMNSETVKRIITVENTCDEDMYLRMRLSIVRNAAGGEKFPLTAGEAEYDVNTGGWAAKGDGWYYYDTALTPGDTTAHLLADNKIVFNTARIIANHPNETLSLSVEVQAVQTANNGGSAQSAKGWPEEVEKP